MSSYLLHLDESVRWKLISVGGFVCSADALKFVEARWAQVREAMGIGKEEPLKWNFGQTSRVRLRIEEGGWTNRERRRVMLDAIRDLPIILLADVLYDERDERRPPLDFYRHALDWLVLRFRNFITDMNPQPAGPRYVILDKPSPAPAARSTWDDPRYRWLREREQIWHVHYQRAYLYGFQYGSRSVPSIESAGFYPSVVVTHAKFNPLLEIADAVAGLALDFVDHNIRGPRGENLPVMAYQDEQMIRVARKFRSGARGNIFRYGFAVFPERTAAVNPRGLVRVLCTHPDYAGLRDL